MQVCLESSTIFNHDLHSYIYILDESMIKTVLKKGKNSKKEYIKIK